MTWVKELWKSEVKDSMWSSTIHHLDKIIQWRRIAGGFVFSVSSTDAILAIEHLFLMDEVIYTCDFVTYLNGNEVDTNNLVILVKPIGSAKPRK